jgi:hypothetical protein
MSNTHKVASFYYTVSNVQYISGTQIDIAPFVAALHNHFTLNANRPEPNSFWNRMSGGNDTRFSITRKGYTDFQDLKSSVISIKAERNVANPAFEALGIYPDLSIDFKNSKFFAPVEIEGSGYWNLETQETFNGIFDLGGSLKELKPTIGFFLTETENTVTFALDNPYVDGSIPERRPFFHVGNILNPAYGGEYFGYFSQSPSTYSRGALFPYLYNKGFSLSSKIGMTRPSEPSYGNIPLSDRGETITIASDLNNHWHPITEDLLTLGDKKIPLEIPIFSNDDTFMEDGLPDPRQCLGFLKEIFRWESGTSHKQIIRGINFDHPNFPSSYLSLSCFGDSQNLESILIPWNTNTPVPYD